MDRLAWYLIDLEIVAKKIIFLPKVGQKEIEMVRHNGLLELTGSSMIITCAAGHLQACLKEDSALP